ncbi:MAG: alpha amylase C-terminal domain-containing protein [Actinomycetota bacterium]|nr:alpha amylase C-terminal domain-containing protein [Actinomycetota bacterium]
MLLNLANRGYDAYRVGLPRKGRWRVRLNSDWAGYSDDFGTQESYDTTSDDWPVDGMPCSASIGLGPYAALVLSPDE